MSDEKRNEEFHFISQPSSNTAATRSEFDFIQRIRRRAHERHNAEKGLDSSLITHHSSLLSGIGDDAAVIRQSAGRETVITADLLVEEVDFRLESTPPRLLGHKALAISLSDIAAMGARPVWSLVSIGLPKKEWSGDFKDELFKGYLELADLYRVTLAGGDVSEAKQIVIDSVVIGEVVSGRAVLRSTARAGDQIFVTGRLGGAAAGLKLIKLGARVSEPPAIADGSNRQQPADGGRQ